METPPPDASPRLDELARLYPYETGRSIVRDALVGLPRPPGARRRRTGLMGAAAFLGAAVLTGTLFWALFVRVPVDNPVETGGTVLSLGRGARGTCYATASFAAVGRRWTARSRASTSALCRRPPGSRVTVIYDRLDPSSAVIKTGSPWLTAVAIAVPLVFLALAAGFAVGPVRRLRAGRRLVRGSAPQGDGPEVEQQVAACLYASGAKPGGPTITI
ncbi:MAG: hypothetical protein ACKOK7_03690 [Solirubrobacterales bacterium]